MKSIFFIFVIFAFFHPAYGQVNSIRWTHKLQFRDYVYKEIIPSTGTQPFGLSAIDISRNITIDSMSIQYNIFSFFEKEISYITDTLENGSYILTHEQGHFDLYELYARKMKQYLNSLSVRRETSQIDSVIDSIYNECRKMNDYYDLETMGSYDRLEEWKQRLTGQIDSLKSFKNDKGTVLLK